MSNFSSSGSAAIERNVTLSSSNVCNETLEQDFQLDECTNWIRQNNFKKVCLQFPDDSLCIARQVTDRIQCATGSQIFILADSSYASCCVDAVAASHVEADALIHFGAACLTQQKIIPVLHIFHSSDLDVAHFSSTVKKTQPGPVFVFYETQYHRHLSSLKDGFAESNEIRICELDNSDASELSEPYSVVSGRRIPTFISPKSAVYLGSDSMLLSNLVLLLPDVTWYLYSKRELQQYLPANNKFLMKRLHLVEKLKDAAAVGILVGTLSVDGTLSAVDRIKSLCKSAGKKSYTVAVGRPNVAKLANFPEIDVFVLVSCPENQLLINTSEFYQPIVSLLEVELAFGERIWSPEYSLDFRQLQHGGRLYQDVNVSSKNDEEADVSLITGKVRQLHKLDNDANNVSTDLIPKVAGAVVESRGSEFLSQRSWSGLQQKLGETPVEKAVQGRSGIPMGYQEEGSKSSTKLKLLCLHGYRQDATKLRQQTGSLRKILKDQAELEYISAPFSVVSEGESSRSWWFTKDNSFSSRDETDTCTGLEESLRLIEEHWAGSRFDGILGFSQGACLVSLINALAESGQSTIRPKFVVIVSGFKSLCKAHASIYPRVMQVPSLHVFGETDQVIPCEMAEELASIYHNATIIRHSGGHFVPGNSSLKCKYLEFLQHYIKS